VRPGPGTDRARAYNVLQMTYDVSRQISSGATQCGKGAKTGDMRILYKVVNVRHLFHIFIATSIYVCYGSFDSDFASREKRPIDLRSGSFRTKPLRTFLASARSLAQVGPVLWDWGGEACLKLSSESLSTKLTPDTVVSSNCQSPGTCEWQMRSRISGRHPNPT
jgi:hypothetical protein